MRLGNEAVVVKGKEYQGNVFGGFRRSTILGCYDNRGWPSSSVVVVVVAAAVVEVVGVVTEAGKRKAKRGRRPSGLYPVGTRTRCEPLLQIRNM